MTRGDWQEELGRVAAGARVVILTDSNVAGLIADRDPWIVIPAGEANKNLATLAGVWRDLERLGATRSTVLACVGGGVVTDLGGFAAATFKRGIRCVNVPTTLLGMADAAIGGKTAIDFDGLKNQIGAFRMPEEVIVDFRWLRTLPERELRCGMAEVVKSMLLGSCSGWHELTEGDVLADIDRLGELAWRSALFKERIVAEDPCDRSLRRQLNFGHTVGHAVEALSLADGVVLSHGEAVAVGMSVALAMSCERLGFPEEERRLYEERVFGRWYRPFLPQGWTMPSWERMRPLMLADKKNAGRDRVNFVLLRDVGCPELVELDVQDALLAQSE